MIDQKIARKVLVVKDLVLTRFGHPEMIIDIEIDIKRQKSVDAWKNSSQRGKFRKLILKRTKSCVLVNEASERSDQLTMALGELKILILVKKVSGSQLKFRTPTFDILDCWESMEKLTEISSVYMFLAKVLV